MRKKITLITTFLVLSLALIGYYTLISNQNSINTSELTRDDSYYTKNIQPIFDAKCIACHSCYNSPCQLNFTSYHSTIRGANKTSIYDFPLLEANKPTRMFIDASTEEQWRDMNFFSVLGSKERASILNYMISLPHGVESKKQKTYESEVSRVCIDEIDEDNMKAYQEKNPAGRMPYGLPALSNKEIELITTWQDLGSPGPNLIEQESKILRDPTLDKNIKKWESFLNQDTLKSKLTSRYIYEHLYLAHIYFDSHPKISFRLVRSKNSSGKIEEISTVYPFDNPGDKFSYRLRPNIDTIVHKSHIPFKFTDKKLEKWNREFLQSKWTKKLTTLPGYGREGSNPYKVFEAIPVQTRYKFLIDESSYHIMTFIKGPVCRGQTALNVINDHFWVFFLKPKKDPLANSSELYKYVSNNMVMPSKLRDDFSPLVDLRENYWKTVEKKYKHLKGKKVSSDWIWDGEKKNENAAITVFRHFDSAHVLKGLQGRTPKTVWVLDYHIFESIYYNLTAGYNVFGPLLHQVNSRLFMEISRIASEDLFLTFLPKEQRIKLRNEWNQPTPKKKESISKWISDILSTDAQEEMQFEYKYHGDLIASDEFKMKDAPKSSFLKILKEDILTKEQLNIFDNKVPSALKKLSQLDSGKISNFPDTMLISYKGQVYSLIHNKDHYNVSMLFYESDRRNSKKDTLDIIPGVATSYPNLFMNMNDERLRAMLNQMNKTKSSQETLKVLKSFSVKRSDKMFWDYYMKFSQSSHNQSTNEFGFLDLNRYQNFTD